MKHTALRLDLRTLRAEWVQRMLHGKCSKQEGRARIKEIDERLEGLAKFTKRKVI